MNTINDLFGQTRGSSHTAYQQLIAAVELARQGGHWPVTKNLYPDVARLCKSKSYRVEKNIRMLRDKLWGNAKLREQFCAGSSCHNFPEERPTTATFIELLAEYEQTNSTKTPIE